MTKIPKKSAKKAEAAPVDQKRLNLAALGEGMPGLTEDCGRLLGQAAAVCLEDQNHRPGVRFERLGLMADDLYLEWSMVDDQIRRCYADMQEATEPGACGVAILVLKAVKGLVVVERARKATGIDYWVGEKDSDERILDSNARLEVSGIRSGKPGQVEARIKQKKAQMGPTDGKGPGFVAVVEFGTPVARVEVK